MKTFHLAIAAFGILVLSSFSNPIKDDPKENSPEGTESQLEYRIQLGAYSNELPQDDKERLTKVDQVTSMQSKGKTVYLTAPFDSEEEASMELPEYRQMGFKNAVKVIVIEGYVITSRVFHLMYDNRNKSAAEKYELFTPEVRVLD
ncbi:MAG: SPOR domain-containing protein [Crocinitomicaceae bacterium]|nr:SPOR domain-containing protein [Crocinitomicaceae bacterium]